MAKTGAWLQTELNEVESMTDDILDIMFDSKPNNARYFLLILSNLIEELRIYISTHGDHPDDYKPNLNHLKDDK